MRKPRLPFKPQVRPCCIAGCNQYGAFGVGDTGKPKAAPTFWCGDHYWQSQDGVAFAMARQADVCAGLDVENGGECQP